MPSNSARALKLISVPVGPGVAVADGESVAPGVPAAGGVAEAPGAGLAGLGVPVAAEKTCWVVGPVGVRVRALGFTWSRKAVSAVVAAAGSSVSEAALARSPEAQAARKSFAPAAACSAEGGSATTVRAFLPPDPESSEPPIRLYAP